MEQRAENSTDRVLLDQLLDSRTSNDAIAILYRQYYGLLSHFIINNNGSGHDAQDIFQEVIVAFVHSVRQAKFRGESSIKTFLFALNKNLWLNELKRRSRSIKRELTYEVAKESKNEAVDAILEAREGSRYLLTIINDLGDACKKILLLFYYQNKSMKEIADETDYENEQVVRNKKYKCLKKLEEKMTADPLLFQQLKNLLHG